MNVSVCMHFPLCFIGGPADCVSDVVVYFDTPSQVFVHQLQNQFVIVVNLT